MSARKPPSPITTTTTTATSSSSSSRPTTAPPIFPFSPRTQQKSLPPNYKATARKVTMIYVALPIAIVTSWFLFQRGFRGQDRKRLVRDPLPRGVGGGGGGGDGLKE